MLSVWLMNIIGPLLSTLLTVLVVPGLVVGVLLTGWDLLVVALLIVVVLFVLVIVLSGLVTLLALLLVTLLALLVVLLVLAGLVGAALLLLGL